MAADRRHISNGNNLVAATSRRLSSLLRQRKELDMASLSFRANMASCNSLRAGFRPSAATVAARCPLIVENKVAIRFSRGGRRKAPFYRIVAIDSRKPREGRPLEFLGYYDPMSKETNLNAPSIKKWLSTGAQCSQTIENLLKKAMILDP